MNKFITSALLLAAGTMLANAATVTTTYMPLVDDASSWTLTGLRNPGANNLPSITDGTLASPVCNWTRSSATYSFGDSLVLASPEESLSFSFTLSGSVANSVGTLALLGTKDAEAYTVIAGVTYSGTNGANTTNFLSASAENSTSDAYLLNSDSGWGGNTWNQTSGLTTLGAITSDAVVFSGTISWVGDSFLMTLTQGNVTAEYNLGTSYALDGLVVALDGASGATPSISELTITHVSAIPEPSAFGLLAGAGALALVAARRRRAK